MARIKKWLNPKTRKVEYGVFSSVKPGKETKVGQFLNEGDAEKKLKELTEEYEKRKPGKQKKLPATSPVPEAIKKTQTTPPTLKAITKLELPPSKYSSYGMLSSLPEAEQGKTILSDISNLLKAKQGKPTLSDIFDFIKTKQRKISPSDIPNLLRIKRGETPTLTTPSLLRKREPTVSSLLRQAEGMPEHIQGFTQEEIDKPEYIRGFTQEEIDKIKKKIFLEDQERARKQQKEREKEGRRRAGKFTETKKKKSPLKDIFEFILHSAARGFYPEEYAAGATKREAEEREKKALELIRKRDVYYNPSTGEVSAKSVEGYVPIALKDYLAYARRQKPEETKYPCLVNGVEVMLTAGEMSQRFKEGKDIEMSTEVLERAGLRVPEEDKARGYASISEKTGGAIILSGLKTDEAIRKQKTLVEMGLEQTPAQKQQDKRELIMLSDELAKERIALSKSYRGGRGKAVIGGEKSLRDYDIKYCQGEIKFLGKEIETLEARLSLSTTEEKKAIKSKVAQKKKEIEGYREYLKSLTSEGLQKKLRESTPGKKIIPRKILENYAEYWRRTKSEKETKQAIRKANPKLTNDEVDNIMGQVRALLTPKPKKR